jgi:hypothetical protein
MKKITVLVLILLSVISLGSITAMASSTVTIIGPTTIHKAKNSILTTSDILNMYSSNIGEVAVSVDEFTGNGNIKGSYLLELYATDGIDLGSKVVTIIVIESLPTRIKAVGDNKNIYTNTSSTLTQADILTALRLTEYILITDTTQMWILNNQYTSNAANPGSYFYEFRLVDASGYDNTFSIQIITSDAGTLPDPDYVYTPEPGFIDQAWAVIKAILVWLLVIGVGFIAYKFIDAKAKKVLR